MTRSNSSAYEELHAILRLLEQEDLAGTPQAASQTPGFGDSTATLADYDTEQVERCLQRLAQYRNYLQNTLEDDRDDLAETPRRIDRFTIVSELGRGGCGVVFLAHDPDLNRLVALKVPHPAALISPELRRRFVVEARASASLEHPAIVRVYEVGSRGALSWIASEYCNGCTLQAYLEQNSARISPRLAAEKMRQLAEAVDYAHRHGVLHRDIKPANILLAVRTPLASTATELPLNIELADCDPKLADFGLAKILTESTTATMTIQAMGTPAYMSPEQISGNSAEIGTGCDIYALGIILYEMLAGAPGFRGATREETWKHIIDDELRPISLFRNDVPSDLEAIVARATDKSPGNRYRTAGELAEDLGRFLGGEPTLARPLGFTARSYRWIRRHPTASGILATLIVAVCVLVAGGIWHLRTLEDELRVNRALREIGDRQLDELRHTGYLKNLEIAHGSLHEAKLENAISALKSCIPKADEPDHRDFVWYHLWRRCHHEAMKSLQHQATVSALAYSVDGTILASGDHASKILLSLNESGNILATLTGHTGNINALAFQGKKLLSGADDGCIIVWDSQTFEQLKKLQCHEGDLLCLAVHPSEPWVVTGGVDAVTRLWNFKTGELLQEFVGGALWIRGVGFSPDGQRVLATGHDGCVRCWDLEHGRLIWESEFTGGKLHALAVNEKADSVFVGGYTGVVYEYKISDGTQADYRQTDLQWIRSLTVCPKSYRLAVSANSGRMRIWDIRYSLNREPIFDFPAHEKPIWAVAYSSAAKRFATGSTDCQVKVWLNDPDLHHGFQSWPLGKLGDSRAIQANFTTGVVTVAGGDGWASVNLRDFGMMVSQNLWPENVEGAVIDNSQAQIVLKYSDRRLKAFDLREQRFMDDLKYDLNPEDIFAYDPHEKSLGFLTPHGKLLLWSFEQQKTIAEYQNLPEDKPRSLTFSPNGRFAALQYEGDRKLQLLDLSQPEFQWSGVKSNPPPAFSEDSQLFAFGSSEETIKVVDLRDMREIHHFPGKACDLITLAFTPDKRLLAAGFRDGSIQFRDLRTGKMILEIPAYSGIPKGLCFSPDSRQMIVIRANNGLKLCFHADFHKP